MPTPSYLSRVAFSALLCWTGSCEPAGELDGTSTPADEALAARQAQSARIPRVTAANPPLLSNLGGTIVAITGTSFQSGTQVYFGGQPATSVYQLSSTQLQAVAPALPTTTGPVAVKVVNPDGRQSERSDVLSLFTDNLSLLPQRNGIPTYGMQVAAVADLNADGKLDLVLYNSAHISILLARGRGDYVQGQSISTPSATSSLVDIGDFNGDGSPDLIMNAGPWSPEVDVYLNQGNGTFGVPLVTTISTLQSYSSAYAADVNGDGRTDLVVAGQTAFGVLTLQSFLAGSDGRLGAPVISPIGQSLGDGKFQDVNGDGKVDLVAAAPGTSQIAFLAGKGDGNFAAPVASAVGSPAGKLVLADFTGDAKLDVATLGSDGNVSLRVGNGTGTFSGTAQLTGNANARALARGDVNGDGKTDLVVGWDDSYPAMGGTVLPGGAALFAGNGDGSFQVPRAPSLMPATGASDLRIVDADSDGKADVFVAGNLDGTALVLYGRGGGNFIEDIQLPAAATELASADLNGDGKADVVAVSVSNNKLYVLLGNGDGTTAAPRGYDTDRGPSAVAIADINGDGKADLLVSNYDAATVSLLPGNGDGTFQPQRIFNVGSGANALVALDLSGDGKIDVVTANYDANTVSVLLNNGAGGFGVAKSYATGTGPTALAAGDFNGDGRPDVVTANADANNVSYLQGSAATAGALNAAKSLATGKAPVAILARDANGDGKLDIVTGNTDSFDVSLLAGKGDGTFNAASSLGGVGRIQEMTMVDLSGDGRPDLLLSSSSPPQVSMLYGFAGGVYSASARTLAVSGSLATADMNGDGKLDVLVGQPSGAVLLHFNTTH